MKTSPDGSDRGPFWSLFEQSHIPMALVDRNRCYVAINDAEVELFKYPRDEVIGALAGRTAVAEPAATEAEWARLLRTNELYGERIVERANGTLIRVSYAAHGTSVAGQWMALFVTLSAQLEPGGEELIRTAAPDRAARGGVDLPIASGRGDVLTAREREVVRRVALGAGTRQIAADMYLSPATIRSHVRNAMVKTGAHTRAQLVAIVLGDRLVNG
jgi:DNA-binding CsgD family transcriptional regulator